MNNSNDIIQMIANISTAVAVIISIIIFSIEKKREMKVQAVKAGMSVEHIVMQWSFIDMVLKESFSQEYALLIYKDYSMMKKFNSKELNLIFNIKEQKRINKIFKENEFNTRNIGSPQLVYNVDREITIMAIKRYQNVIKTIVGDYEEDDYLHIFHRVLIDTFNKIETLCTMINSNVADKDTVFITIGASLCNYIKSQYYYIVKTNEQYSKEEQKLQNTISVFKVFVKQLIKSQLKS